MKNRTILTYIDLIIFKTLIQWVQENKDECATLTYQQVVEKVNHPSVIPVNLGSHFERILNYCLEHNAPVITALVVKKNDSNPVPGAGFFEALGIKVEPEKRREYWETICKQVYSYENWDEIFPKPRTEQPKTS